MVRGAEPRLGPAPYERPGADLPGLLLGRAPPARGLPLLVLKGRAKPPSLRNGGPELERPAPEVPALDRPGPLRSA